MKRFLLIPLVVLLVSGLILGGCAAPAPAPAPEKTWNLKLAHEQTEANDFHVYGHVPWAQNVEKATNGRVKVTIFPNQVLMKSKDAWEGVQSGIADVAWIFTGFFPGQFDLLDSISLPFMAPNAEVASRTAWALYEKFPEIQAQSADAKILTVWTTEPYWFLTTKKHIKVLEDFKGMKIRMTGGPPTEMMKLLGGVPMMVPMPDNYLNLQKGVTDGMAGPAEAIVGFRIYEVAKYYTFVPTVCVSFLLAMNKDVWNEMPPDIQEAIMSVSGESQSIRYGGYCFDGAREKMPGIIEKAGYEMITYTPPKEEVDRWIEVAGKPLWDGWAEKMEAKGHANAREILDETLRLVEQYSAGRTDMWRDLAK